MKKVRESLSKVFQLVIDVIVGLAIYYALTTFAPTWSAGAVMVLTLGATALFAEVWEVKKKN